MNKTDGLLALAAEMRSLASGWSHGAHPLVTSEYANEWAAKIEAIIAEAPQEAFISKWAWDQLQTDGYVSASLRSKPGVGIFSDGSPEVRLISDFNAIAQNLD